MHWTTCMNSRGLAVRCWKTCKTIWLRTEVRGRSHLRADWVKMACSRFSNIKHKRLCFTTSPNSVIKIACVAAVSFPLPGEEIKQAASKRVENSTRSWEFLANFEVVGNVVKSILSVSTSLSTTSTYYRPTLEICSYFYILTTATSPWYQVTSDPRVAILERLNCTP